MADWSQSIIFGGPNWAGNPPVATLAQLNSTIGIISTVSNVNYVYTSTSISTLQSQVDGLILSTGGTTANWASFPALTNVNINTKNITGVSSISAVLFSGPLTGNVTGNLTGNSAGTHTGAVVGNVSGNVTGNLTGNVVGNISNAALTVNGQYSITETADVGSAVSNYASYGTVNISGKGGLGGIVNITADVATPLNPAVTVSQLTMEAKGNYGLITPGTPVGYIPRGGLVSITARQGLTPTPPAEVTSALFANGEIALTAYSYGIVPGLIKMSAGANAMYAGAFSPITGIFGNNYIAATVANTMTAGLPPGGIPTLVGTNYFYAVLGIGGAGSQIVGNRFQGGVGIDFLQPFPNGDLVIQSNANGTDTVVISGVKSLAMSNGGNITGVGNLNVTTINSAAYPPIGNQTFSNISTSFISTGRLLVSSINDSIIVSSSNISGVGNLDVTSLNSAITVTSSNLCNVGQFRANNGIFNNAIAVTNNAQVGSLTSLGAVSGTTGSFSGNVGVNILNAAGAVNGATAVISGSISGGSLFTLNNTVTGTLAATSAVIGALTVSGITRSDSVSTNNLSTAMLFVSSINGQDINTFGGSTTIPSFLSTNIISSGTAFIGTISSSTMSTGASFISSINGVNIASFGGSSTTLPFLSTTSISSATASISSINTNNVSTAIANISSLSIYGNLVFFTAAKGYDISKTLTSTVTNYDLVSSLTQDIFGYKMNLTTTGEPQSFDMGSFFAVTDENATLWSKKQITYSGELAPGQAPTINIIPGAFVTSDYFDVKNIATNGAILNIWNPFISGGLLLQMSPGTYYRFTYSGSAWTFAANPTNIGATYFNTFAIYQGWEQTTISTGNVLNIEAGATNIPGFTAMDITNINYLTAGGATFSTIVSPLVSSSAMFTSSINRININTILNPTSLSSISTTNISTAQINTSSITANTLTFTSPLANPTGSWDINRTFYSNVVSGSYDSNVSSLTSQILNYNLSATIPNIASFFFGTVFTIQYNDAQWASQFLVANSSFGGTIILLNASATNFFDCQNQSPLELLVTNNLSGSPVTLFTVPAGNLTIYRVTATVSAGVTTWSYAVSPAVYSTTTVANNLLLSVDLQNTYISSINRVQFNTGDVYFASPIYAPNAYFDNVILNNVNASTLSSVNVNAGNLKAIGISTNAISTNSITTNTLTTNSLITTAPLTVPSISTNRISTAIINVSSMITPTISTLTQINNRSISLLFNPGDKIVFSQVNQSGGTGWYTKDIDLTNFQYGVYTAIAICRNNNFRTLSCTVNYSALYGVVANQSAGLDNNNGVKWSGSGIFLRFQSQTDGPGDTFDFQIWWTIGQTKSLGELPPEASTLQSMSTAIFFPALLPWISQLSSILTTSSITIGSDQNISILANLSSPAYVSTGNITIAGTNVVGLIGDETVIAGSSQIVINCDPGDVNIIATSSMSLVAGSNVSIQDMIFTTNNPYNWTGGTIHTLYGDVINGDKYLQWSYNNNPGTLMTDNDSITLDAPVINAEGNLDMSTNNIKNVGTFSRMLSSTAVDQPVMQFGEDSSGSGNNGSVVVNLPVSYTSASSYSAFATMEDSSPSEISVVRVSATSIEIYWAQAGSGSHIICWQTVGI